MFSNSFWYTLSTIHARIQGEPAGICPFRRLCILPSQVTGQKGAAPTGRSLSVCLNAVLKQLFNGLDPLGVRGKIIGKNDVLDALQLSFQLLMQEFFKAVHVKAGDLHFYFAAAQIIQQHFFKVVHMSASYIAVSCLCLAYLYHELPYVVKYKM